MNPLAGIDDVDWAALSHAYGAATDVPGLLRDLRSGDAATRYRGYHELYGNVYHQGTRWRASASVIPFLAALADDPATPTRGRIVNLIKAVGIGDKTDADLPFDPDMEFAAADTVPADRVEKLNDAFLSDAEFTDQEIDDSEAACASWNRDCYRAAMAITGRIAAWLADDDSEVVEAAAELIVWFRHAAEQAVPTLLAVADGDGLIAARTSANLALAHIDLGPHRAAAGERLIAMLFHRAAAVRLTAAVALTYHGLDDVHRPLVEELLLNAPDQAEDLGMVGEMLSWDRALAGFAARARNRRRARETGQAGQSRPA